jgi:hypothetical protein
MKYLNKIALAFVIVFLAVHSFAQTKGDVLVIEPKDLLVKNLQTGNFAYLVYRKKTKESSPETMTLVKIKVESKTYNNKPAFAITQRWESDGNIVHTAYTVLDAKDFSTLLHDTYWKRLGYSQKFDFETKKVSFDGNVPDSDRAKTEQDFNESFNKYNLNWHSDLIMFTLLPYKENRTFKINFFDPGFGKAEEVLYAVTGSDFLINSSGEKIDCWVLEHKLDSGNGYQKFWISKKKKEVLKEEDLFNNTYRYKLKFEVTEEN